MKIAATGTPPCEFVPVLIAILAPEERARLMTIGLQRMEPLAAPEPSLGALIELRSGRLAAVVYGEQTGQLTVELARSEDNAAGVIEFLREMPIDSGAITWLHPNLLRATFETPNVSRLESHIGSQVTPIALEKPNARDVRDAEIISRILRLAS